MAVEITISDLSSLVGRDLAPSDWIVIDQPMIDAFAQLTGDLQWIHVDPVRTAAAGHSTLAHGFLVLSLIPSLSDPMLRITDQTRALNYGLDRLRFTSATPSGSRVRLHRRLSSATPRGEGGVLVANDYRIEIEGQARPALVAVNLVLHQGPCPTP